MKRILLDQGLPRSAVTLLAAAGWDVVHVSGIGMSRSADADILRRGLDDKRVCITLDADFHSLLATRGDAGPSVVRIRRKGLDATALAALLQRAWPDIEAALDRGAMVTITDHAIRSRRLPVTRS